MKPKDDISLLIGDQDGFSYCGERNFRITSTGHEAFLTYTADLTTLTLLSTLDSEIATDIPITIESFLIDYPNQSVE